MSNSSNALVIDSSIEIEDEGESLEGVHFSVEPGGGATHVDLKFSHMAPFRCHLPLGQATNIMSELRQASLTMAERQHISLDRDAARILEICEGAIRPSIIEVLVDPMTHDRVFIFQFEHHGPLSVRVSPEGVPAMLLQLAKAVARSIN